MMIAHHGVLKLKILMISKKQLIYDDAILKVYNMPVLYFPKFFHPDPTVVRQSGFLQPQLNNSDILVRQHKYLIFM